MATQRLERVSFTSLLCSAVAHYASNKPSAVLVLQPTEADVRDFMVSDLEPLFEAYGEAHFF